MDRKTKKLIKLTHFIFPRQVLDPKEAEYGGGGNMTQDCFVSWGNALVPKNRILVR
jgi:hypothetical protein